MSTDAVLVPTTPQRASSGPGCSSKDAAKSAIPGEHSHLEAASGNAPEPELGVTAVERSGFGTVSTPGQQRRKQRVEAIWRAANHGGRDYPHLPPQPHPPDLRHGGARHWSGAHRRPPPGNRRTIPGRFRQTNPWRFWSLAVLTRPPNCQTPRHRNRRTPTPSDLGSGGVLQRPVVPVVHQTAVAPQPKSHGLNASEER